MIVAYTRSIAMEIYHKILERRPGWTEKVAIVMTQATMTRKNGGKSLEIRPTRNIWHASSKIMPRP